MLQSIWQGKGTLKYCLERSRAPISQVLTPVKTYVRKLTNLNFFSVSNNRQYARFDSTDLSLDVSNGFALWVRRIPFLCVVC